MIVQKNMSSGRQLGFTLLEILVVTAIILIVTSVTVFHFNRGDGAQAAAERLVLQFETARDEALASGRTLAWTSDGAAYQFWFKNQRQEWEVLNEREGLRTLPWADGVHVRWQKINQQNRPLGDKIIFPADGVIESFELELQGRDSLWQITGDVMGRFKVKTVEAN
ncbi:GspH/FimT family pseudopilin [Deefgea sp. H3-26]|uniref:Type II secretion system protein H n=2 Tax=Deefgea salmonis TaxID=2875502 RepID=A0ABS8BJV1_9NEIS|nr:GspH/FimT family pseudopilin [Deefgea salmonis]